MTAPSRAMTAPGQQRATRQGEIVLQALDLADGFRSAQDLYAIMRQQGARIGLTTVYRHLNLMTEAGIIDAVHGTDGSVTYRRCDVAHHHHHIVCRSCGASVAVEAPEVETWAAKAARKAGYRDVEHTLEIFGTCKDCHAAA